MLFVDSTPPCIRDASFPRGRKPISDSSDPSSCAECGLLCVFRGNWEISDDFVVLCAFGDASSSLLCTVASRALILERGVNGS